MSTQYQGVSFSYNALATETATTQRNTDGSGMAAHLSGLGMPDLYPVDGEVVSELGLEGAAREYKMAMIREQGHVDDGATVDQLPDIVEGDNLILNGATYRVRAVEEWHFVLRVVVGEVKGTA